MTMTDLPMIAVIDIDGVLADVRHRLHHVTREPKDWPAFFAAADKDPLLEQGADTVRQLGEVYPVVYLSGRPERLRRTTLAWLACHELPEGDLVLRPQDDHRPARLFKVEALDRLAAASTVVVLVDDDPKVLDAARTAGYDVLPATWMDERTELHEVQERDGRT